MCTILMIPFKRFEQRFEYSFYNTLIFSDNFCLTDHLRRIVNRMVLCCTHTFRQIYGSVLYAYLPANLLRLYIHLNYGIRLCAVPFLLTYHIHNKGNYGQEHELFALWLFFHNPKQVLSQHQDTMCYFE